MMDTGFGASVAATYHAHLGELFFEPFAADLARRLEPGDGGGRILEVAAGTGILTRRLREALPPSVHLLATDIK